MEGLWRDELQEKKEEGRRIQVTRLSSNKNERTSFHTLTDADTCPVIAHARTCTMYKLHSTVEGELIPRALSTPPCHRAALIQMQSRLRVCRSRVGAAPVVWGTDPTSISAGLPRHLQGRGLDGTIQGSRTLLGLSLKMHAPSIFCIALMKKRWQSHKVDGIFSMTLFLSSRCAMYFWY